MSFVLIRGGGPIASGVALRLHQSGYSVVISEKPMPLTTRRRVAFAEAVYSGEVRVEGCVGCRVDDPNDTESIERVIAGEMIPVLVDPNGEAISLLHPKVVVEGRLPTYPPAKMPESIQLLIGLGAGFVAGENCDAVIETNRGDKQWRVIWEGAANIETTDHETVAGRTDVRILRAPVDGAVENYVQIGDHVVAGQSISQIYGHFVSAPIDGIMVGVIHRGLTVKRDTKIAEIDPRNDPRLCDQVPDQAIAAAGGVLEAISKKFGKFR